MNLALWFTAATALTFALTALILKFLIPKLKSHKMGQKILDIGPRWHKNKEGTPTMGGISFTAAATAVFLPCLLLLYRTDAVANLSLPLITLGYGLLNGAIGFIDDYTKFIKKQNEGLTASGKIPFAADRGGDLSCRHDLFRQSGNLSLSALLRRQCRAGLRVLHYRGDPSDGNGEQRESHRRHRRSCVLRYHGGRLPFSPCWGSLRGWRTRRFCPAAFSAAASDFSSTIFIRRGFLWEIRDLFSSAAWWWGLPLCSAIR